MVEFVQHLFHQWVEELVFVVLLRPNPVVLGILSVSASTAFSGAGMLRLPMRVDGSRAVPGWSIASVSEITLAILQPDTALEQFLHKGAPFTTLRNIKVLFYHNDIH